MSVPQKSGEAGRSLPPAAVPVMGTAEAVSAMDAWWAQRPRYPQVAPHEAAFYTRYHRRRGEMFRREIGRHRSVWSRAVPMLPNPNKSEFGGG